MHAPRTREEFRTAKSKKNGCELEGPQPDMTTIAPFVGSGSVGIVTAMASTGPTVRGNRHCGWRKWKERRPGHPSHPRTTSPPNPLRTQAQDLQLRTPQLQYLPRRQETTKKINKSPSVTLHTLGARGHLPTRYMLNTLQLLVKSSNFPGRYRVDTFQMSTAVGSRFPWSETC